MIKFKIRTKELLAALVFASEDETRFILNGVYIEVAPNKSPLLIGTDGRRLAVIESQCLQEDIECDGPACGLVIGVDAIKAIADFDKRLGKVLSGELLIEYRPSKRIIISFAGGKIVTDWEDGALQEGNFPDWRKTIPTGEKQNVPHVSVNATYLADFVKAAKLLDVEPALMVNLYNSESAYEVRFAEGLNFYGLVMPMRNKDIESWQPEFLGMPKPIKQAA